MSASHSPCASPASSSSRVASGSTGQLRSQPTSRRNSFDMVIAVANGRAAADAHSGVIAQASASPVSDSSSSSFASRDCLSSSRRSKPFDVESQTGPGSFEDVDLQERWPTASRLGLAGMNSSIATLRTSDAAATAAAFQSQASSGKRSFWKEWAPYFGL